MSLKRQPCLFVLQCAVIVLYTSGFLHLPTPPQSPLKVGICTWVYDTSQEACLTVCSTRVTASDLRGGSGRFETSSNEAVNEQSCQSVLFEVLTAVSANNPGTLGWGLFDVETSRKRNVKRDVLFLYFVYPNSHLGRLRWTLITLLRYSLCQR